MKPAPAEIQASLAFYEATMEEETLDPAYPRRRAAKVMLLSTRAEREASLERVPPAFRGIVKHFVSLMLAEELSWSATKPDADALIEAMPGELVALVRALARSRVTVRRRIDG